MTAAICRICVHETSDLVLLLNVYYEHTPVMLLVKEIFQINICEGEDPNTLVMCGTCNNALSCFYPFYKMVRQAQQRLQDMRTQSYVKYLESTNRDLLNLNPTNRDPMNHDYTYDFDKDKKFKNDKSTFKEEVVIEYQGQGERECNYGVFESNQEDHHHMKDEQVLSKTSGKSDWMKEEGNMEYKQSQHDSDYMILESSQSSSQVHSNQSGNKSETRKKTVCVNPKDSASNVNAEVKIKKSVFEDTERIVEARESLLRKYKVEDICQDGKWILEEDDMDEVISLFVDLKCLKCPARAAFSNYKELHEHATKTHRKAPKLKCCNKETERIFMEKHILYYHILKKNPPKKRRTITCPICHKQIMKNSQKNHLSVHLPPEMRQFRCNLCNFGCGSKGTLNSHIKNVHPEKLIPCDECDKFFKTIPVLQVHKQKMHSVTPVEYLCQDCGKKFKALANLNFHISNAHRQDHEKVKCEVCGEIVKVISYKRHKRIHKSNQEELQCPHCPFKSKHIERHIKRVHNKVKPYPCSVCSMEFHTNKSMLDHMASRHTGIPRYKCNFCEKTFMTSGNYHTHRTRMHPTQLAEMKMRQKMEKSKGVVRKSLPAVPSKRNQVVKDVDSVLKNIEELVNNK